MLTTCKLELVKGYLCQIEKSESNDYCHRHQRYFERDTLLEEGKRLCSKFIYGCDRIVKTKFARCEESEYEDLEEFIHANKKEEAVIYIKALLIVLNKRRNKYIRPMGILNRHFFLP